MESLGSSNVGLVLAVFGVLVLLDVLALLLVGGLLLLDSSFALLDTLFLGGDHVFKVSVISLENWRKVFMLLTHPLVLTRVTLVVDLLLNDVLVGGVVGVEDLDGLPAALALVLVLGLKCQTGNDDSQSQTLSVDTSLDKLLLTTQVGIATDNAESSGH